MIKKKNLFKNISLFLCLVPMLLLSFFCLIPQKQDYNVSAADQVLVPYSFSGSNVNLVVSSYSNSTEAHNLTTIASPKFIFGYQDGSFNVRIKGSFLRSDVPLTRTFDTSYTLTNLGGLELVNVYLSGSSYHLMCFITTSSSYITHEINRVVISSKRVDVTSGGYNYIGSTVTYYDIYNNFIEFYFKVYALSDYSTMVDFMSYERNYYLFVVEDSLEDNVYYQNGYSAGYSAGVSDGESIGYNNGYGTGFDVGYGNGYNEGLEFGNDYTFNSLLGAVIDVPVNAFKSLLNFEILGVNILSLLTGLLSVAIIVLIVKLCMGGK